MEHCDVLIIGAGPAGSSLAWGLRASDLDVVVLDRNEFPRNKVCAGWITPAVVRTLRIDPDEYQTGRTMQPIHGFRIGIMGEEGINTVCSERPVSYGIRRCEFDNYLLRRCNARLKLGQPFRNMIREGKYWIVNEKYRASIVVGAGGHFCPIARYIGAKIGSSENVVTAQEMELKMTEEQSAGCKIDAKIPELFFCQDLKGYGWVFRKGDYLNIGIGREDRHRLSDHTHSFFKYLQENKKIPGGISEKCNGHAYLLYGLAQRELVHNGLLLAGDAAGLAYSQSGEGIRPAVESGLLAATAINQADGDYSIEQLGQYHDRVIQRFGRHRGNQGKLNLLPDKLKLRAGRRLLSTRWFVQNMVINRWFLRNQLSQLVAD